MELDLEMPKLKLDEFNIGIKVPEEPEEQGPKPILPKTFRLGELFCGAGGFGFGALNVRDSKGNPRITHAWATDIDRDACATYQSNICPRGIVICQDIRDIDLTALGHIDALAFGFPCGERKGLGGRHGPLYSYGIKALNQFQPIWFVAENMYGLSTGNNYQIFRKIIREMEKAGYKVTYHEYHLEDYGLPQARCRVFVTGFRKDTGLEFRIPEPSRKYVPCSQVLENIPPGTANHVIPQHRPKAVERLKHILPGQNAFNSDLPPELKFDFKVELSHFYRRLDPAKPAYTLTAAGGGGTRVYHYRENRALTNREYARLQSFPDNFVFHGKLRSVRKQIGMAIPPLASWIICKAILDTVDGQYYDSVKSNIRLKRQRPVKYKTRKGKKGKEC
jgi:DNA (cytosine-5)-methyltransferase 1